MSADNRLQPWLALADELEALDRFVHDARLTESYDYGANVAQRMRAIGANRWTWYGWKRDQMQYAVEMEMRTFNRRKVEGFFYGFEETDAGREVLARMADIERKFEQLGQRKQ
jgi:hypothetical protein